MINKHELLLLPTKQVRTNAWRVGPYLVQFALDSRDTGKAGPYAYLIFRDSWPGEGFAMNLVAMCHRKNHATKWLRENGDFED